MVHKDNTPQGDECSPAPVSSIQLSIQQLMALQIQVLQSASCLQQVLLARTTACLDGRNDVSSVNPISSTTPSNLTIYLEKLVETQTLLPRQVSQLPALSRQMLGSQRSSHKEAAHVQLDELARGAHPQQVVECHFCELYGVPGCMNNANEDETTTTQKSDVVFLEQKRKISPQE